MRAAADASAPAPLVLHGYWRSTASYRVRAALGLKGLAFTQVTHDLRQGEQRAAEYRALAPQGLVPALAAPGLVPVLTQSMAIVEWLEERYPDPPLLPADADGRAVVRQMAGLIGCDIHPLHNLRVLDALRGLGVGPAGVEAWIGRWITAGFDALEPQVARFGAGFAFGQAPGMADCFLVPQTYAARRFAVDLAPYPHIARAVARAEALPAFQAAHPARQPDADPA